MTLMPNPFYQIYEGAALLACSRPYYLNNEPETGLPDFDAVPDTTPRPVVRLMRRCLLAKRTKRTQSMKDVVSGLNRREGFLERSWRERSVAARRRHEEEFRREIGPVKR